MRFFAVNWLTREAMLNDKEGELPSASPAIELLSWIIDEKCREQCKQANKEDLNGSGTNSNKEQEKIHTHTIKSTSEMSDFDQIFNKVLEFLRSQERKDELLTKFSKLPTDREKVEAVLALHQVHALTVGTHFDTKDEREAECARLLGDASVLKGDLESALSMYSKAVRLSPQRSQTLAQSYLARCTLLHERGFYGPALEDAKIVIQMRRDGDLLSPESTIKLLNTAGSCHQQRREWQDAANVYQQALQELRQSNMSNEKKAQYAVDIIKNIKMVKENENQTAYEKKARLPELNSGRNKKLPSGSASISIAYSQEKGRHMVANEDIKIGSVLIIEEPYAWSLSREAMVDHCAHCCCFLVSGIPCIQCASVSYCSVSCRTASWQAYHRFECQVFNQLLDSAQLSVMALVVYRIIATAAFGGQDDTSPTHSLTKGFSQLHEDCKQPSQENEENVFLSNDYKSVFNQITNSAKRSGGDMLKRAISAVFLVRCLMKVLPELGDELTLVTAMYRHLQSCSCNAYQINELRVPEGDIRVAESVELGGAVYPTISLSNHSCNPNISRQSHGKVCVVRALRTIHKNEEILDNYGPHFLSHSLNERRDILESQYSFACMCDACSQGWPTADVLQTQVTQYKCRHCDKNFGNRLVENCTQCGRKSDSKNTIKKLDAMSKRYKIALESLICGRTEQCLEICIKYAALLETVVVQPNIDLVRCQQTISQCWSFMANVHGR